MGRSSHQNLPSKRVGSPTEATAIAPTKKKPKVDESSSAPYDSDDEPPSSPDNDRLNWRLDPEESHSDWEIRISSFYPESSSSGGASAGATQVVEIYHVHKHMVAVGSKKCEYFSRLFKSSFSESTDSTSCIELDPLAAEAFPIFLDFMYSPNKDDLKITTATATALHYLGKYFENRRLRWLVKQFWSTDIGADTCGTYFCHAKRFHDEKIRNAVVAFCASNIEAIAPENSIIQQADTDLMVDIVSKTSLSSPEITSQHLSRLIATFCSNNSDDLTAESFFELTNHQVLPVIDCQAAMELVAVENRLVKDQDETQQQQLSSLQERCSAALAGHLGMLDFTNNSQSKKRMQDLNSKVLVNILSSAQRELQILKSENQRLLTENNAQKQENERLVKENQSRKTANAIFVAQNETLHNEIRALTKAKDSLLGDIQGLIAVPPDGTLQNSIFGGPQDVTSLPSFDRNQSLKRHVYYQTEPFTNILGKKEPGRCHPVYYFKEQGS